MAKKRNYLLGEELIRRGFSTLEQIDRALSIQKETKESIGSILVRLGFLSEHQLLEVLSDQLNLPYIDPATTPVDKEVFSKVSAKMAKHYHIFPIRFQNGGILVVSSDPHHGELAEELRALIGMDIFFGLSEKKKIDRAIQSHYGIGASVLEDLARDAVKQGKEGQGDERTQQVEDVSIPGEEGTIRDLVNQLLADAQKKRASDIHIEPFTEKLSIRYRIDGVLHDAMVPDSIKKFHSNIISRIKIMANLDVSEKRLPQDGRIKIKVGVDELDLRISILPTVFGESLVIRILTPTRLLSLEQIGFNQQNQKLIKHALQKHSGIILLTGPTGSGKTTTLYACLKELNDTGRKIITIEDPVEYQISGVVQMQVHPKIGLTFASGLRHMLRHDPDVMMVGEIRDIETAEIAIRSAMTGHLVFSTLHTNDACGAVARLVDMGIEPFLVASSLECVIAQRLVRKIQDPAKIDESEPANSEGFLGRIAIHEVLLINDILRDNISKQTSLTEFRQAAVKEGMIRLVDDGLEKVAQGLTAKSEVMQYA
ncbi:MAG: type II secretion system protein GspE [Candidatus Omnitrophica bacterium CG11_big_fil_rev_8_21_14_0_20_45_26]|uniref:Type II secretion system protein GspE n=1 Tax=Candidatus Abzuiibacterium crystallinum TaxID=1974748 RepID=A0A2H0LP02_9BACT|nr:MAG: type II secretion system protein GspE [Candidatus Omnitrophica bacterium CG11_big_fil_rev_8_21_14_0_20_45_26]PIW65281.1 MAG: type II secretion system protein GspE [Candidatus Omnitrophica bacterium CG12_big_fil_rev_8_21_14_0_65_45_16]